MSDSQSYEARVVALKDKIGLLEKMRDNLLFAFEEIKTWWHDGLSVDAISMVQGVWLAAFKARFAEFQDHLGSAMKLIAEIEQEDTRRFTYVVNYMEQLRIVDDMHAWLGLRDLRNKATHDYSDSDADKTKYFSELLAHTPDLFQTLEAMKRFVEKSYR